MSIAGGLDLAIERGAAIGCTAIQILDKSNKQWAGRPPGVGGTKIVIETMAGQGTVIGHRFEQIAAILARVKRAERLGVCLDTCHVFAAGYDLRAPKSYAETMRRFDGEIGLSRLRVVHVNDSKKDLGCRVDRHEHIGKGFLGLAAFRLLMNDARLESLPLLLETPKDEKTYAEDVGNLNTLIGLVGNRTTRRRAPAASAGGPP